MKDKPPMEKKLCVSCKYYRKDWLGHLSGFGHQHDTCVSPNTSTNLVTGNGQRFCDMLRDKCWESLDYSCGPDGKFWEAK
jgi:hypothetical protein